jgi:DNA-directed RNA polymerase subunit omega
MNKPPLDDLLKVSSNRYVLAIVAAKYARVLTDKAIAGLLEDTVKPVSKALEEIATRKISHLPPGRSAGK